MEQPVMPVRRIKPVMSNAAVVVMVIDGLVSVSLGFQRRS